MAKTFRENIPNILSLTRMLLALPFVIIIHDIFIYECTANLLLLLIFIFIISSDVADGYLARKLKCATGTGAKLDIASDAVYTISALGAFVYFKVIPIWFIYIMFLKLMEFTITSILIKNSRASDSREPLKNVCFATPRGRNYKGTSGPKHRKNNRFLEVPSTFFFDKIGKVAVSAVMLLPGIFVFRCVIIDYKTVMNIIIYIITAMLAVSFFNRIMNAVKTTLHQ